MFTLNTSSGSFTKVIDDKNGLTTLMSPSGRYILYSESRNANVDLFIRDTENNTDTSLNVETLPEKCVWSNTKETIIYCAIPAPLIRGAYPENWYLGIGSFNDNIWQIDIESQEYDLLLSEFREIEDSFDIINPQLTPEDDHFIFMNKKDLSLWSYRLKD